MRNFLIFCLLGGAAIFATVNPEAAVSIARAVGGLALLAVVGLAVLLAAVF